MSSSYEFWLTDDAGRRLMLLDKYAFVSYTRAVRGYGVIQMGIPFEYYHKRIPDLFRPDWRIDVWRSPGVGYPKRREGSFFLRKFMVYQRKEDNFRIIEFYGRSPLDILRRQTVSGDESFWNKTDYIDDMMKAIVTDWFYDPVGVGPNGSVPYQIVNSQFDSTGEFTIESDQSLGPQVTQEFYGRVVLDILQELSETSFFMNTDDPDTNQKIYFDVVEGPGLENGFGYVFRTYANIRGVDRTAGQVYSVESGNIVDPVYYEDRLDEQNVFSTLSGGGGSALSPDRLLSRWNVIFYKQVGNQATADQLLYEKKADISMNVTFVNSPGGPTQPRSLYGVDWDMGDLLPVEFAGRRVNCEVVIVYVSINEDGVENVIGRTDVN